MLTKQNEKTVTFFMLLMLVAFAASTLTSCEEVDEEMNTPNELTGTDENDESDELDDSDESDELDDSDESDELDDSEESDDVVIPDVYTPIYTAADMYNVRDSLAGNYILMNDISLAEYDNWELIGSYTSSSDSSPFTGTFDGGGYTITGLTINSEDSYQGLFGYVSGGTIKNLIIKDAQVSGGSRVGALCGYLDSGSIESCGVEGGTVKGSGYDVGGVVGSAFSYSSITITSCYNTGDVSGSGENVGGVVGRAFSYYSSSSSITFCYNTGTVSGSSNVGGVVGYAHSNSSCITITSCYNTGAVSGSGNYVGGVVGRAYSYSSSSSYSSSVTITSCYNTGDVLGSGNYVGGVVGRARANADSDSDSDSYSSVTITSCYNTGNVSGNYIVGGVVGYAYAPSSSITITSCYNTGDVKITNTSNSYVGGVVGDAFSSSVTACYFIDQEGDSADYGVGSDTSSDYDYMKLSSVSALNAVVTTMNTAAGDTYYTAGSPSTTNLPYLFDENLVY